MSEPDFDRELSRAAKQVKSWTRRRDRLIVQGLTAGRGVRELARLAGLTHPTVLNIQRRDKAGASDDDATR